MDKFYNRILLELSRCLNQNGQQNYLLIFQHHLEIEKATLVGHSLGGQIATDFALTYPKRVSELVLVSSSLSGFRYSQEFEEWIQRINAAFPDMEKMIELSLNSPSYRVIMAGPHRDLMVEMFRHHLKWTFEWATFESVWPQPPAIERLEGIDC